ncbi:MAG: hypothetical protein ABW190_02280 [Rhizobacter sp.]
MSLFDGNFTAGRIPGPIDSLADPIYRWARREITRQVQRSIHTAGEIAYDAAMRELRALRDDVDRQLRYIAGLPKGLREQIAYEAFASGFTHYLPKKFLRHYVWGGGIDLKLTEREMIDCNPWINLSKSKAFVALQDTEGQTAGMPVAFELNILAATLTNGTLGQFTVRTKGTLIVQADGSWKADGVMSFYDEWDFDPKDFSTGGRSFMGEVKTRGADTFLPGKGFKIYSETVAFSQSQDDATVVWSGGTPVGVPDRIAEADVAITKHD